MESKRRRFATRKHKKRSLEKSIMSVPRFSTISKLEGIEKLFLSPLTQQILDCRIGINITIQEPWIFVPKEKILENIELHENSSEFLPLKNEIEKYPDDKILIGCYGHAQDEPEEFLVCITMNTVQMTLEALQMQEDARHKKILESIVRICGTWVSLGSEIEVNENKILTLRKPFAVHLTSEGPNFSIPSKFTFRFVDDSPDGYVELLSPRQTFRNVYRRRVSMQVQSTGLKVNALTQTIIEPVMNKTTTCPTTMKPKPVPKGAVENFIARIDDRFILDILQTNYYMDLCNEDYRFRNALHMKIFKYPLCVLSFQDICSCRGKKVSSVSWNAIKSGILAASYVTEFGLTKLREDKPAIPNDTVMEDHLILIWSYTDAIKPHLYLHCYRDVRAVSFCPYNANIVVGGCDNGQIAIWDIRGRLEFGEKTKVLTRQQQNNRLILGQSMTWMKKPPEVQHVFPTILSKIEVSHTSPVSCIEWLPPGEFITKNGSFEKCPSRGSEIHVQFLSCSKEGGCIDIWDVGVPEDATVETKKKRIIRLNKVPSALTKFESPLKMLAKNFIPVFRIWVSNADTRKPFLISTLLQTRENFKYRALNPESKSNILERTIFELLPRNDDEPISEQKLICASPFGEIRSLEWEGLEYNQGCLVNSAPATVSKQRIYHDGPVVVCIESPTIKDLLLTIGGRVFAIWNAKKLDVPLFWRKSMHPYVTGNWVTTQAFQIRLIRYDTYKEIWDLMEDSKQALKIIKSVGRATKCVFNDFRRTHAIKGTYVETNDAGEINIYSVSESRHVKEEEIDAVINYLLKLESFRVFLEDWTIGVKEKFPVELRTGEDEIGVEKVVARHEPIVEDPSIRKTRKSIFVQINRWQAKEEAFMREVLLANKHLKVDQIVQNSDLLRQAEELRKKHSVKFAEQIKNKDKNMQGWRMLLIPEQEFIKKKKITVTFSKDMALYMKQSYMENFKEIEKSMLYYIKLHEYHYFYNWAELNKRAKASWNGHTLHLKSNILESINIKRSSRFMG